MTIMVMTMMMNNDERPLVLPIGGNLPMHLNNHVELVDDNSYHLPYGDHPPSLGTTNLEKNSHQPR